LAHEAMRQAWSHGTGASGETLKQIIVFSSHATVTRYTRLPLQKKIILVYQEGGRYLHVPQSSSAGSFQVSVALSIWHLVSQGS